MIPSAFVRANVLTLAHARALLQRETRRPRQARVHESHVLPHRQSSALCATIECCTVSNLDETFHCPLARNERGIIYALPPLSHPCADSLPPPHTPLTLALSRARRLGESFWDCSFEGAELPALRNCSTLGHGGATPAHRDGGTSPTLMIFGRGTTTCGS